MWPKVEIAVVNMAARSGHDVTSVFWKIAREVEVEYWSIRAWASGRRERSARRTEQPFERRREAKEKFMPVEYVSMLSCSSECIPGSMRLKCRCSPKYDLQ